MIAPPLNLVEAAEAIGIAPRTLRGWLRQSKAGRLVLRGQSVVIAHGQTGRMGQGRITIEPAEIERVKELMTVSAAPPPAKRRAAAIASWPMGIPK